MTEWEIWESSEKVLENNKPVLDENGDFVKSVSYLLLEKDGAGYRNSLNILGGDLTLLTTIEAESYEEALDKYDRYLNIN